LAVVDLDHESSPQRINFELGGNLLQCQKQVSPGTPLCWQVVQCGTANNWIQKAAQVKVSPRARPRERTNDDILAQAKNPHPVPILGDDMVAAVQAAHVDDIRLWQLSELLQNLLQRLGVITQQTAHIFKQKATGHSHTKEINNVHDDLPLSNRSN